MRSNGRTAGRFAVLGLFIRLLLASVGAAGAGLIGNDYNGVLYDVNPATGALSNPRPTGLANLCGLAYAADGTLYGFNNINTNGSNLGNFYRINPATGAATLIGGMGLSDVLEGDLAFDPTTGKLYGVQDASPTTRALFSINPSSGVAADIGAVISAPGTTSDLSAMLFDALGNLYVLDTGPSALMAVNKITGSVLTSVTLSLGGQPIQGYQTLGSTAGMAIDPISGIAYLASGSNGVFVSTDSLYTVNLTTGALTLIGTLTGGNEGLAGLAFPPLGPPTLSATKTHTGNFTQGQVNAQYTVTISNSGKATTSTVTVTENIPSGLTLVSMIGTGWICTSNSCTRNDVLAPNASYPPINVIVNVAANAPSQVTNQVTVSGGGSSNATASDVTNIGGTPTPAFFTGEAPLGSGVYYLQFPNGNLFGYYNLQSFPIIYHYDMGFEAFVDGGNGAAYLYDFTSGHWFYTSSSLFPYVYDFTLTHWLYYFPDSKNPGHYTANPRSFADLTSGKIITM